MILDFISGKLDGDSWENLCDSCYRMRYQEENYQKIQANQGGDAGVEGYTQSGITYQCYYPEKDYNDNELYEKLREKMTKDIAKLINPEYIARQKALGIKKIKEWHFVIPEYKDPRILQHAENKYQEVLKFKRDTIDLCNHIDDEFRIVIKVAEDFKVELTRIIRNTLTDVKLEFAINHIGVVDWSKCSSEKVNNIIRKVKAVMNTDEDDKVKEIVDVYVEAYIKGLCILEKLRNSFSEVYEDIYSLEQAYKKEVALKTKMNPDSSINYKMFNDIMEDYEKKLIGEFTGYLSTASIMELKLDMISGWLADCSMEFKRG